MKNPLDFLGPFVFADKTGLTHSCSELSTGYFQNCNLCKQEVRLNELHGEEGSWRS
jgi:hypothetical protein